MLQTQRPSGLQDDIADLEQLKTLIQTNGVIINPEYPAVHDIGKNRVVKHGLGVCKAGAFSMQFIQQHTTLPVPKVYAYFQDGKRERYGYIVMERMPGVPLVEVLGDLDDSACDAIVEELKGYMAEMKRLDSPGSWGMLGKNGVYHGGYFVYRHSPTNGDAGIGNSWKATSMKEFLAYFAISAGIDLSKGENTKYIAGIDFERPPYFTQGDLLPENIMYDVESRRITGIIDWQLSGWYPYFWNDWVARKRRWAYGKPQYAKWVKIFSEIFESTPEASESFDQLVALADFDSAYPDVTFATKYVLS
jgi:hypothetical protein